MSRVDDTCRAPKACKSPKLPAPPLPFAHFLIRPYPDICWTDFGSLSSLFHPRWEMKNSPLLKWPGIMSSDEPIPLSCLFNLLGSSIALLSPSLSDFGSQQPPTERKRKKIRKKTVPLKFAASFILTGSRWTKSGSLISNERWNWL